MNLLKIDLGSFTRIIWISQKTKDEWQPRIEKAKHLANRLEIESVARGYRRVTTVNVPPQGFERYLQWYLNLGITFVPIHRVKRYEGFAHYHTHAEEDDPQSFVYGIVCRDKEDGLKFKEYSSGKNGVPHDAIGELLGYPKCCRDFFQEFFGNKRIPDTIWQQAENTKDIIMEVPEDPSDIYTPRVIKLKGHPFANAALRYFGIRLSPQLPCSWDCADSIKWGEELWWPLANELDPDAARDLRLLLEMPMRWDLHKGLAIVDTPIFRGITNSTPSAERYVIEYQCKDPQVYSHEEMAEWTAPGTAFPYTLWL